ncbi:MAG: hypothetical protein BGO09_03540 [Bacteroidetes bacterium 47-18]|nr:MAG: hypothetical protein BGO09_03540 [Bacteroidetes bacterium 47-18]
MKQIILTAGLLLSVLGMGNAKEAPVTSCAANGIEATAEAAREIHIHISRGRLCLWSGSSCTIDIRIRFESSSHLSAKIAQFDQSYEGETIEEFTFEDRENDQVNTYYVPTQTLRWSGEGFILQYRRM